MTSEKDQITPEQLVDLQIPRELRLSPSAEHIIYNVKASARKGDQDSSALWLADCSKEKSARQLTSGSYNDRSARWSPAGDIVAFVSDREKAGETSAIYLMSISGGEPYAVTNASHKSGIDSFAWSPNGKFIAFTCADEKSDERKKKDEDKDDVMVYGEDWRYNRLRILHVATREVTTIYAESRHVVDFCWDAASKHLAVVTNQDTLIGSSISHGSRIETISITGTQRKMILDFPGDASQIIWHGDTLLFRAPVIPNSTCSSGALWWAAIADGEYGIKAHGQEDDIDEIRAVKDGVFVRIQAGLDQYIYILDGERLHYSKESIADHDVIQDADGTYHLAFITSSASSPPEVYFKSSDLKDIQLSDHGATIRSRLSATVKSLQCPSFDGKVKVEGLFIAPSSVEARRPLPTLVHIHGGPYHRDVNAFSVNNWDAYMLAQQNYALLKVNYRGSSGRGQDFARYAAGGMGTVEYDDVLALVEYGISKGLIDKERLAVGGWSQGGFLSYISAVRNGAKTLPNGEPKTWTFKGAICGAGVTDWDAMSMQSDAPAFESELAGGEPWGTVHKSDVTGRQGSAIWEFAKAAKEKSIPPVLLLHGEKDERVPLTQAVAFHRGCLKWGVESEMCVYPREPHGFRERAHCVDRLKRVVRFLDDKIGG